MQRVLHLHGKHAASLSASDADRCGIVTGFYRLCHKDLYNGIPNVAVWRVL
jgi:hypothetical protein